VERVLCAAPKRHAVLVLEGRSGTPDDDGLARRHAPRPGARLPRARVSTRLDPRGESREAR